MNSWHATSLSPRASRCTFWRLLQRTKRAVSASAPRRPCRLPRRAAGSWAAPIAAETVVKARAARSAYAAKANATTLAVIREVQKCGVTSLAGIARTLEARGVKTSAGRGWQPVQVSRLLTQPRRSELRTARQNRECPEELSVRTVGGDLGHGRRMALVASRPQNHDSN